MQRSVFIAASLFGGAAHGLRLEGTHAFDSGLVQLRYRVGS